jgi:hypothetical protein
VADSMQDGGGINGAQEEVMQYRLIPNAVSRGPLILEALSLWLEILYSTANLVTSRSL